MNYDLGVQLDEYQHWRNLLDSFILARQSENTSYQGHHSWTPSYIPQSVINTPASSYIPSVPAEAVSRTRSASPPWSPKYGHRSHPYAFPPSPGPGQRKRTAIDAFAKDTPTASSVYEQMRLPARKTAFGQTVTPSYSIQPSKPVSTRARPKTIHQDSGLGRSSSLSRQIARLPGSGTSSRRGSAGHMHSMAPETDLRHAAANHAQMQEWHHREDPGSRGDWAGYSTLIAPYERPAHYQAVPPEVSLPFRWSGSRSW